MKERKQEIDIQIRRYFDGNLKDSEITTLLEWLDADAQNAEYFKKFCSTALPANSKLLAESWKALKSKKLLRESAESFRMSSRPSWGKKVLHMTRLQFVRYAAVLIIGLIASQYIVDTMRNHLRKDEFQWVHAETQAGQKTKIVLPDGSIVWMNSESRVSFPSSFASSRERIVKLEGEAFFEVAKQGRAKFTVQCLDYDIHVKGTRFNVMAYSDFNRTETTLVEGLVEITKGNQSISLKPGERAVSSANYLTKSRGQVRQATEWKENKFYFDNVPFAELARRLERWYDVKITLEDQSLRDIYYSGYFKNEETVWQVLDVIQMTTPIVYEREDFREITIERKNN